MRLLTNKIIVWKVNKGGNAGDCDFQRVSKVNILILESWNNESEKKKEKILRCLRCRCAFYEPFVQMSLDFFYQKWHVSLWTVCLQLRQQRRKNRESKSLWCDKITEERKGCFSFLLLHFFYFIFVTILCFIPFVGDCKQASKQNKTEKQVLNVVYLLVIYLFIPQSDFLNDLNYVRESLLILIREFDFLRLCMCMQHTVTQ